MVVGGAIFHNLKCHQSSGRVFSPDENGLKTGKLQSILGELAVY